MLYLHSYVLILIDFYYEICIIVSIFHYCICYYSMFYIMLFHMKYFRHMNAYDASYKIYHKIIT